MIPEQPLARLTGTFVGGTIDFNERDLLWRAGLEYWMHENPIFGVGNAGFRSVADDILGVSLTGHNMFITVLVETGLVGILIYGLFWANVLPPIRRYEASDRYFILGLVITWVVYSLSASTEYEKITWMVYSIVIIMQNIYHEEQQPDPVPAIQTHHLPYKV